MIKFLSNNRAVFHSDRSNRIICIVTHGHNHYGPEFRVVGGRFHKDDFEPRVAGKVVFVPDGSKLRNGMTPLKVAVYMCPVSDVSPSPALAHHVSMYADLVYADFDHYMDHVFS